MVLLGNSSEKNRHHDHQPVQSIETSKSGKSQRVRVLTLLVCVRIKHCVVPPLATIALSTSLVFASPRAIARPLVRDRCSCPRPSAAPNNPPPTVHWGCTPFAGPAPAA